MNQTYEGTTIGIKPPFNKYSREENVEEVKASGNHLSGKQPDYQNPEGPTETGKSGEERRSIVKLWSEMTKLKKRLLIGGIILAITFTILFTLLIVTIRTKPRLVVKRQEAFNMPNSNEVVKTYQVNGVRPNIFSADKTTNFTMTTITKDQNSRLLQEDQADDPTVAAVILSFDFPGEGVKIRATSPDDLMVQVDMDEMLGSYQNKRLLFQAEMAAALRTLQEDDDQSSSLAFSDPNNIKEDAINSLLRAVAKGTSEDPNDLDVEQFETVNLLRQSDGSYLVQEEGQSSRLLRALSNLRGLQEWEHVFDEVHDAVVVPKIEAVKAAINELVLDDNVDVDNLDVKTALRNSNFQDGVEVDIVYEIPETTTSRLLQDAEGASSAPSPASASVPASSQTTQKAPATSTSSQTSTSSASSNAQAPKAKSDSKSQSKTASNKNPKSSSNSNSTSSKEQSSKDKRASQAIKRGGKKYGKRPIATNKRTKSKDKKLRSATTDEATANFTLYCSGGSQNKTCSMTVVNNSASPIKITAKNQTNEVKQKKSTPKKRTIVGVFKSKNKRNGKKRVVAKPESKPKPTTNNKTKNLNTEPAKNEKAKDTTPKVTPAPNNTKAKTESKASIAPPATSTKNTPIVAPAVPAAAPASQPATSTSTAPNAATPAQPSTISSNSLQQAGPSPKPEVATP